MTDITTPSGAMPVPILDGSGSLSMLVHAPSKVGKSTLSTTVPMPAVVLDAEGGWKFVRQSGYRSGIPLRRREWNPLAEPPPRYDGTWDFCHVTCQTWNVFQAAYQWLSRTGQHDFKSVVLDSVTETQRRLKTNLRGMEQMRIQDWGDLLNHMDRLVRDLRDLTLLPAPNPVQVVMFIAETEMKDGKWRPAMQGQIGRALPYWVDVCGYLYAEMEPDENGEKTRKVVKMLIGQGILPTVEAGERVQGTLPDIINNPHVTKMLNTIYTGREQ